MTDNSCQTKITEGEGYISGDYECWCINPLPFDGDMDLLHVNDLHRLCEEVLTELTGNERPDEQHIHDFIVETFAKFSDNL